MEFKKIRLKTPILEAVQVTEENMVEVSEWCGGKIAKYHVETDGVQKMKYRIIVPAQTLTGRQYTNGAYVGDWIIRHPDKFCYEVCGSMRLRKTYDDVANES